MKCIILAAGYATHLYPLTKNFPKPLLEVAGKPVLDRLEVLRKSAVITEHRDGLITSMEEKSDKPKGNMCVPAFYYYKEADIKRIPEALAEGCGYDAPGSFAAWLSRRVPMYAFRMPGMRHDIGNLESYEVAQRTYKGIVVASSGR